jgi:hypothetical protein
MSRLIALLLVVVLSAWPLPGPGRVISAGLSRSSPEVLAKSLYQAWRQGKRKTALAIAEKSAVTKLFGVKWRAMKFGGCHGREEGGFECLYTDTANDLSLAIIVEGGASLGGYNVSELSFSSEE